MNNLLLKLLFFFYLQQSCLYRCLLMPDMAMDISMFLLDVLKLSTLVSWKVAGLMNVVGMCIFLSMSTMRYWASSSIRFLSRSFLGIPEALPNCSFRGRS